MAVPRLVSIAKTTTVDNAEAFTAGGRLYAIGGIISITTQSTDLAARLGTTFKSWSAGSDISVELVPLHELLVKPTAAGVHGTITFFGTVVDTLQEVQDYLNQNVRM